LFTVSYKSIFTLIINTKAFEFDSMIHMDNAPFAKDSIIIKQQLKKYFTFDKERKV